MRRDIEGAENDAGEHDDYGNTSRSSSRPRSVVVVFRVADYVVELDVCRGRGSEISVSSSAVLR
jgi:hypothetical protein